jgi:uncharacterized protein (DUF427 family)
MLPDLNLNHFASTASTHSSHSVSIESLEDSVADARSNKVMYYACCALVFFMHYVDINFNCTFSTMYLSCVCAH